MKTLEPRTVGEGFSPTFAWLFALLVCFYGAIGHSESAGLKEYEVKSALLYHVLKYVEWPEGSLPSQPPTLQIGLVGQLSFPAALELLNGKKIEGRELVVRRISNLGEVSSCQVIFVGSSERSRVPEIMEQVKHLPILTVGDFEGFLEQGGMVNLPFSEEENKVVMQVNRLVAEQAQITIRSSLLRHAKLTGK